MSQGGLRIDQLPVDPSARSGSLFHLNQRRPPETAVGVGGPAGLLHFIYRSIYLDQYVSSEFAPPITEPKQQKRFLFLLNSTSPLTLIIFSSFD